MLIGVVKVGVLWKIHLLFDNFLHNPVTFELWADIHYKPVGFHVEHAPATAVVLVMPRPLLILLLDGRPGIIMAGLVDYHLPIYVPFRKG